jgi:cytochrome c oxidase subunit 1
MKHGPKCILVLFIGANLTLPMHWLGFAGMPRRSLTIPTFAGWNFVCSYGAYVSVVSLIVFFIVVAEAFIVARPAPKPLARFRTNDDCI